MKIIRSLAVLGSVSILALAYPAFAGGPPYNVKVARHTTGSHPFTATSQGTIDIVVDDLGMPVYFSCDSGGVAGVVNAGPNATGAAIAEITSSTWMNCVGPSGIPLIITPDHSANWDINAVGNTATSTIGDIIDMTISGFNATVDTPIPGLCSFDLDGNLEAEFDELTEDLIVSGDLTISGVTGCFGSVVAPGPAQFEATYDVYTPAGVINITD